MSRIEELLQQAATEGVFSCAAYAVGTPEEIIEKGSVGNLGIGRGPANTDTMYDMASVTKIMVAMAFMKLFESGKVCLDDTVADFLPEYKNNNKASMTIRELLTHTSALHGQVPLFRSAHTKEDLLESIHSLPPRPSGTVEYSSQGMIVLGQIMESIEGKPLDLILQENLFDPLHMKRSMYNPPKDLFDNIASTEDCPWRGHIIIGQVHDENAVIMGGVAGHAGVFSTADDMIRLAQAMLSGRTPDGNIYLHDATRSLMTKNHTHGMNLARGLGWQCKDEKASPFGDLFSDASYGHTGFTGTGVFIDPTQRLFTVLLTNRVHPSRDGNGIIHLRHVFNNLSVLTVEDKRRNH